MTNDQIENLLNYFNKIIDEPSDSSIKGTSFSRSINKKILELKKEDFKKFINQFTWVNPVDVLIISINYIEKIKKTTNLLNCRRYGLLWVVFILAIKYFFAYDNEKDLSIMFLSNLGGFDNIDYNGFEYIILKKLDYRLEILDPDYKRLLDISHNYISKKNLLMLATTCGAVD
jgi:hypothetical protein